LGVESKLEQLLERPSRPTPEAGPAWTARILQAGVIYHVKEQIVYCGVDVAKAYLDARIGTEKRRLSNDAPGHRHLIKWVKQIEAPIQVICESSGGYERSLVQALAGKGVTVSLVQANRVRQFARAAGILRRTAPLNQLNRSWLVLFVTTIARARGISDKFGHGSCVNLRDFGKSVD
jgi:hypothetical protein